MDRIASDNPAIETLRTTVARHGGTRKRIELPAATDGNADGDAGAADSEAIPPIDEVVRLVIDGTTYHARIEGGFADADPYVAGAYETPDMARAGDGTDHLGPWLESTGRSAGSTVLLDAIEPGFAYGLREPGERAIYDAVEKPSDSLASIARDLEGGE